MIERWQTKVVNVALLALCAWTVPAVGFGQGSGPKAYCVLDLSAGASAEKFPITYLDAEPADGFDTTEYKTTKLVLKLVEPGSFVMGTNQLDEAHRVTLSRPFYLGLFEVTQKQWECVMGSVPKFYLYPASDPRRLGDALPVAYVSHTDIRGDAQDASYETNVGTNDTFLVRLRAKTGLAFDLPTEAQWEYACRAGTTTVYSYGDEPDGAYAWSFDNSLYEDENYYGVHEVGTKKPNPWGFYDMHGNAQEWCRDVYVRDALYPYGKDPFVTTLMDNTDWRVARDGGYIRSATQNTSAFRTKMSNTRDGSDIGFRLGLDVGGIATTYGPLVPGEPVSIALPDLVGYAAKGLPAGLRFDAKTGTITGAATKPTAADGVTVTFTKRGAEPLTTRLIVGPLPVLSVNVPDAPAGCKVTGTGAFAANRKVTLRATAAKGALFAGWYADAAFSTPLAGEGDVDYRTPSLPYVMPAHDVSLFAKFVPAGEDDARLVVPDVDESVPKTAIQPIVLDVSGCVSLPKVTAKGLPPGLKLTAKVLDMKATKTTPAAHYEANTVYGTPTKSGVYDATFTVTTAGKKTATKSVTFVVVDREKGERVLKVVADAAQGKVTGAGVYAAGTKVTLKATAAKGFVFAGWYRDENCGVELEDDGGLDFRTPTFPYVVPEDNWKAFAVYAKFVPLAEDASVNIGVSAILSDGSSASVFDGVYTSGDSHLHLYALSESLPKFSVSGLPPGLKFTAKQLLDRDGTVLAEANSIYGTATKSGVYVVTVKVTNATVKKAVERRFWIGVDDQTDANDRLRVTDADGKDVGLQNGRVGWYRDQYTVYVGVAELGLPSIVASNATDKLTLSGLPAGMRYDAKTGEFSGVATKAGIYTVTATVRSGRASFVSTFTVEVKPLYEWAVGTFVGSGNYRMGDYGSVTNNLYGTFTVAANGKVSGKVLFDTDEGRLLTATFSAPSLTGYDEDFNVYYCDVSLAFKDGRKIVDKQVRRLYIGAFFYEPESYDQLIGGAWMEDALDEEMGKEVEDGFNIEFRQNVWNRKGFEKLPEFAERKMSVLVIDAPLPSDSSDPEIVSSTASLKLDIDQKGSVAATLTINAIDEDGDQFSRRLVAKGDLIIDDFDSTGGAAGRGVYTAGVPLVFGNFGLLHAKIRMEVSADGKVWAEGCRIVSVDRFASIP